MNFYLCLHTGRQHLICYAAGLFHASGHVLLHSRLFTSQKNTPHFFTDNVRRLVKHTPFQVDLFENVALNFEFSFGLQPMTILIVG